MEYLLQGYELLRELALAPWFSVSGSPINLLRAAGLVAILLGVWRVGLLFEGALVRMGSAPGQPTTPGWYALSRIVRYLLWVVGAVIGMAYLGFDVTNLAVLGGMIGVGVGFGLQNIISNFVSGIIILAEKTIKVGDFVELQSGTAGKVTAINLRYTRITTNDLIDIIVPNSEFISGRVVNWTFGEPVRRLHIPFGVAYCSDKEQVREAALAAAQSVPRTLRGLEYEPDVWLTRFGDNSLDFELIVWVGEASVGSHGKVHAEYMWAIETELARHQIEIPFPQRDLHIRSGTLAVSVQHKAVLAD